VRDGQVVRRPSPPREERRPRGGPSGARRPLAVLTLLALLAGGPACEAESTRPANAIPIGLLLSYTGFLAASSVNSERALWMAVEAVNAGGGVGERPIHIIARDTRSNPEKAKAPTQELLDAGAAVVIGPDTTDVATQVQSLLKDRTVMLPSSNTSSDLEWRPRGNWFVMGAGTTRWACELVSQLRADGRHNPLVMVNHTGQNSALGLDLNYNYGYSKIVLPGDLTSREAINNLSRSLIDHDSYVLAAFPSDATSLIYALTAIGQMPDPSRFYLSSTLHNPAFLQALPKGGMTGAHGVANGTVSGAADFRAAFQRRWQDVPLDDAYPFYDAGAVVGLALARAWKQTGAVPELTGLVTHILAVTRAGGMPVAWNELARGLALVRDGVEVEYFGLSGTLQFDATGESRNTSTRWWTIDEGGFTDIAHTSACK
jgi:ABC-type branched-subunit amino acid transport system substrate-binding protein